MAEYLISVKVRVEIDTNKDTYVYESDKVDCDEIDEFVSGVLAGDRP